MRQITVAYIMLFFAILLEVTGSAFLQRSDGFTKLFPTLAVLVFYSTAFWLLALTVKTIPLGIAYAIWCGIGIVLTACISRVLFKQYFDTPALLGMGFILSGVVIINIFSKTAGH